jgi:Spx/MgsR family transcriptional regulator
MVVYGIKNCDTVKKALAWLKAHDVEFEFYDYKKAGITEAHLKNWVDQVGWESLINKKGTTWKKLSPERQDRVKDPLTAIELMREYTSVIRRPLIEEQGKILFVGFDEDGYLSKFA